MLATKQILTDIARNVFENLVFMSLQPEPGEGKDEPAQVRASVHFRGPVNGTLALDVPEMFLTELVVNMLGVEEYNAANEAQGFDALGELANVICGNLISKLIGPEHVFDLDAPLILPVPEVPEPPADNSKQVSTKLHLEKGCAELTLVLDGDSKLALV